MMISLFMSDRRWIMDRILRVRVICSGAGGGGGQSYAAGQRTDGVCEAARGRRFLRPGKGAPIHRRCNPAAQNFEVRLEESQTREEGGGVVGPPPSPPQHRKGKVLWLQKHRGRSWP